MELMYESCFDAWQGLHDRFNLLAVSSRRILVTASLEVRAASFHATCTELYHVIRSCSSSGRVVLLFNTEIAEVYALFAVTCLARRSVVPINGELSEQLIARIIHLCSADLIIASVAYKDVLESLHLAQSIIYLEGSKISSPCSVASTHSVSSNSSSPCPEEAYVLCTSGSTDTPKLVIGSVTALVHRLQWQQEVFASSTSHTVLRRTPTGFIDSITEIYSLLFGFHALAFPLASHISSILSSLVTMSITHITLLPSQVVLLLQTSLLLPELQVLFITGQAFSHSLVYKFHRLYPHVTIVNLYGCTETMGDVLYHVFREPLTNEPLSPPAGLPIPNNKVFVLDDNMRIVERGELYVSGVHLALGYLNDDELTAEKFIANTVDSDASIPFYRRLYATGDVACYDSDGSICVLGRLDDWVKVNGVRVHISVVEAVLQSIGSINHKKISDAAVVYINDSLCGVVQCTLPLVEHDVALLRVAVRNTLKKVEEVPDVIISMEQLPRLANGKLDRKLIRQHVVEHIKGDSLAQILKIVRGADALGDIGEMTLHQLGVDSLKCLEIFYVLAGGSNNDTNKSNRMQKIVSEYNFHELMHTPLHRLATLLEQAESMPEQNISKRRKTEQISSAYRIEEVWSAHLLKCIDAAPVFVEYKNTPMVLIGSHAGIFSAYHANTGEVLWSARIDTRIEVTAAVNTYNNSVCFIDYKGCMHCLSLDGTEMWSHCFEATVKHSPVVAQNGEDGCSVLYVGCYNHILYCLCGDSGAVLWNIFVGGSIAGKPLPLQVSDYHVSLIAATTNGVVARIGDTYALGTQETSYVRTLEGHVVWSQRVSAGVFAAPVQVASDVIICTVLGHIMRFSLSGDILWSFQDLGSIFATPLSYSNCIYIAGRESGLICVDPADGNICWRYDVSGVSSALTRVRCEDHSYVCVIEVSGKLLLLNDKGDIVAEYVLPGNVFSSPLVHKKFLFVGCRNDYFYCLQIV